jgi:hypothetical protein
MFIAFLTRFADMVHVLSWRRWGSRRSWTGLLGGLASLLMFIDPAPALGQPPEKKSQTSAKAGQDAGKAAAPDAQADEEKAAPAAPATPVADPAQTRRVAPVEIFKDDAAEAILDLGKLKAVPGPTITQTEILQVQEMANNPNVQANPALIDRVVRGLAAQLTDRKSIESLLEEPEDEPAAKGAAAPKAAAGKGAAGKGAAAKPASPKGDAGRAIQTATSYLLDPIFKAQGAHNDGFLREYRRSLQTHLPPLLKNHLVPRVQAMIVLGEAGNPDSLRLFRSEIASKSQVLWVKLWALEGICNIKKGGNRLTTDEESQVSRTIGDFLQQGDLPWPIQMRGLQAMGWLRQATIPTERDRAQMANAVMSFLADTQAKLEVRCEAARAMGLLLTNAIPRYNYKLVATAAARLVADLANEINDQYSDNPPKAENPTRATYLLALLVGPAYQCFDGVEGQIGSGILRTASADSDSSKYVQKVFAMIKPIAQASIELRGSPSKEYKKRKQDLAGRVAALGSFLEENPPASRRLVPGGPEFGPNGQAAGMLNPPPAQPVAQTRRAR